jgi:hypothetical protein
LSRQGLRTGRRAAPPPGSAPRCGDGLRGKALRVTRGFFGPVLQADRDLGSTRSGGEVTVEVKRPARSSSSCRGRLGVRGSTSWTLLPARRLRPPPSGSMASAVGPSRATGRHPADRRAVRASGFGRPCERPGRRPDGTKAPGSTGGFARQPDRRRRYHPAWVPETQWMSYRGIPNASQADSGFTPVSRPRVVSGVAEGQG